MAISRGVLVAVLAASLAAGLTGCGAASRVLGRDAPEAAGAETGIGVNGYLWRASLDTLSFLPLETADPWGGVINYGWYSTPEAPNERIKATVYILDARLRADALNVTVNRQTRAEGGDWVEAPVSAQTETDLENAILTRARQIRLAGAGDL
ncbi:DUF3576 domain-containing protein [Brevundimonas sp.]|uniref:DUF3576 domain-containing protein n=1 Tax=Brevundimonas sp. TaxID=1871086 RepID=UPI0025E0F588|nr:DUF3576 domain-containing protein [Brevundimonas sp.]